jgi:hypothetical protein
MELFVFASKRFARVLAVLFSISAGCSSGVRIAPAEGTVTKGGKPLDKVMVEFFPETEGPRSFAETDADGHFKLTTDDGKRKGAAVGTHRVVLRDTAVLGDKFMGRAAENVDMSQGRKPRFGKEYVDRELTPLRVEVKPNEDNNFAVELPAK